MEDEPIIDVQVQKQEASHVEISVASTAPANVWCKAYDAQHIEPTKEMLLESVSVKVLKYKNIILSDLKPATKYNVYCYGESLEGKPMKNEIVSTKAAITTKQGISYTLQSILSSVLAVQENDNSWSFRNHLFELQHSDQGWLRSLQCCW